MVATSCHWVKKIISYSNFHQTFQIGSHFFGNTYGLVKKIFRAKKRTSIGLIFSHFRPIFLIFGLFFSPTENFVILFPLLLIFLIVLFVALLAISKSIYKMHKLPKMTQVLWLKVPFFTLERHTRLVPPIFHLIELSKILWKYYFFHFLK